MENAAEALQMAAAVLIFVLALTISINAFSEARMTSQTILDYTDREYEYTYVEENKDSNGIAITHRMVGLESIVPSIYKAYKENYKIVFDDDGNTEVVDASNLLGDDGIYRIKESGRDVAVYSIDLQNQVLGSDTQKEQFIMAILYGNRYADFGAVSQNFIDNLGIYLNETGIYDKIINNGTGLYESLGMYYQEETPNELSDESSDIADDENVSSVPDANKTIKRVVTYSISIPRKNG